MQPGRKAVPFLMFLCAGIVSGSAALASAPFTRRITASITRPGETYDLIYTVGTNQVRVERTDTNRPHAANIVDRHGELTLLFPHNRSFVRVKPTLGNARGLPPGIGPQPGTPAAIPLRGMPGMPTPPLPPRVPVVSPTGSVGSAVPLPTAPQMPPPPPMPAPQMTVGPLPPGLGPQASPAGAAGLGMHGMPPVPSMPMAMQATELRPTGQKTNLLGYLCSAFELRQPGQSMEVWATDQLLPFEPYHPDQPHRMVVPMLQEQWPELLKEKKLFPLLAVLKTEGSGQEHYRFEVRSIVSGEIADSEGKLFQPPPGYQEMESLPF